MKTREADRQVGPLTRRLARLWRQVQGERSPRRLGRLLRELDRSHRRLARRAAALPATVTAERHRRWCVEALQGETRDVEALLDRLAATTSELRTLVDRQLETSRGLLEAAPRVLKVKRGIDGPGLPELAVTIVLALGLTSWPRLFFVAVLAFIFAARGAGPLPRLELRFDGRSLRIVRKLFWLPCWSSTVDLTHFKDVVLTPARLTLRSSEGEQELAYQPMELEQLAAQVREWCACATRERSPASCVGAGD